MSQHPRSIGFLQFVLPLTPGLLLLFLTLVTSSFWPQSGIWAPVIFLSTIAIWYSTPLFAILAFGAASFDVVNYWPNLTAPRALARLIWHFFVCLDAIYLFWCYYQFVNSGS